MSVGSDPIECCVRGRFLCVCVTARRRGFRGGAFCVGAPRNFFRPVSRAFPASVSRRGGDRRGLPFPAVLRISARAGSSPWAFCVGAPRNFFRPVSRAFPASVSRRGGDRRGLPFPAVLRISARAGSSPWAFCVGAPRNFFRPVSRAFPASVSRRGGDRRGLPLPVRCAFRFAARAGSSPPGLLPTTDDGRTSFVPHLGRGGGRRAALLPLFTLRRQGSLLEVFSFRQASDESADRIRQVENALHVAALSGRAAAFGGTRGRRGRTVSLDTGEIMSDEREGADAGKRAGARSGPCPQAVAADESPGVGNSAMGGKVKRRRRKPPAFRKKVTPIGLKPITF